MLHATQMGRGSCRHESQVRLQTNQPPAVLWVHMAKSTSSNSNPPQSHSGAPRSPSPARCGMVWWVGARPSRVCLHPRMASICIERAGGHPRSVHHTITGHGRWMHWRVTKGGCEHQHWSSSQEAVPTVIDRIASVRLPSETSDLAACCALHSYRYNSPFLRKTETYTAAADIRRSPSVCLFQSGCDFCRSRHLQFFGNPDNEGMISRRKGVEREMLDCTAMRLLADNAGGLSTNNHTIDTTLGNYCCTVTVIRLGARRSSKADDQG